jgi:hypothetical protein
MRRSQLELNQLIAATLNTVNIAFQKTATLSSTYGGDVNGRLARYAVDGDKQTADVSHCACADSSVYNWWQVDLGDFYSVGSITLYILNATSPPGTERETSLFHCVNDSDVSLIKVTFSSADRSVFNTCIL